MANLYLPVNLPLRYVKFCSRLRTPFIEHEFINSLHRYPLDNPQLILYSYATDYISSTNTSINSICS